MLNPKCPCGLLEVLHNMAKNKAKIAVAYLDGEDWVVCDCSEYKKSIKSY